MRKKKLFYTASFLFACLFIFSVPVCYALIGGSSIKEIEQANQPKQGAEPVVIPKPILEYTSGSLRDPFKPYIVKEETKATEYRSTQEPPPKLAIQGIIWGGSLPQAIINNTVVKVGDIIEEARVLEINKEGVTVFFKSRQYKLASPGLSGGAQTPE